jgi:hypothetical protein
MIRRIIYVVLISIGVAEMIWGKLWGPLGINDVAGGPMATALGLQGATPAWSAFTQYIKVFTGMWMVVFWFGLVTTVLGLVLMVHDCCSRKP